MSGAARLTRWQILERFSGEQGQRLTLLPWWREAFEALDDPAIRELLLWLPRQSGKSQCLAAMAVSELLVHPGSYVILMAASSEQAQAIYTRKIRKPIARLLRALGLEHTLTKRGVAIPSLESALELLATNEATAPARSPSLLLVDEARDIPDEVFTALAPSVIGVGGKLVIASTAGAPRGFFHELVQHPTEATWLYHSIENTNPHANRGVLDFLRRRLGLISPTAERRELGNEFAEYGDDFLPAALIEANVDDRLTEVPTSEEPAYSFNDLSRLRDLTSLVTILRMAPRRPEAPDHLVVASIRTWDPAASPTKETDFAEVRAAIADLPVRFPQLHTVLVDEGAEAGSVLSWAKAQSALTTKVQGFRATADSNMELWSALAARLHARTLSIPRHERLLAELRGLRQEAFSFGSKWRIVDGSRKFHRDVSLALAGAVYAADLHPVHVGPLCWGGGPIEPDRRSVDELQAEQALEDAERRERAHVHLREVMARSGGLYWPGG